VLPGPAKIFRQLKVDTGSNEKRGGQEGDSKSASVWHCGDRGLFQFEHVVFSVKLIVSVSSCYSFKNRHCLDE
jgi:hypothetical protein